MRHFGVRLIWCAPLLRRRMLAGRLSPIALLSMEMLGNGAQAQSLLRNKGGQPYFTKVLILVCENAFCCKVGHGTRGSVLQLARSTTGFCRSRVGHRVLLADCTRYARCGRHEPHQVRREGRTHHLPERLVDCRCRPGIRRQMGTSAPRIDTRAAPAQASQPQASRLKLNAVLP
jgi:hypothetical protein